MSTTPVSPKVTTAGLTAATTVIAMHLLGLVPFIAGFPTEVTVAMSVLVTGAVTYAASYARTDPLR